MRHAYGDFDARFLGISLTAVKPARWEGLWRFAFGPEVPAEVTGSSDDAAFTEAAGILTVLAHEQRHFHDFLISSFGAVTMRTRLLLGMNLTQLLMFLRDADSWADVNAIPVPLTTWHAMDRARRESTIAVLDADAVRHGGRPHRLPEILGNEFRIPFSELGPGARSMTTRTFGELLTLCSAYQERVQRLQSVPASLRDGDLEPVHLWEASALLVQTQELYNAAGLDAARRMTRLLLGGNTRYGAALRWLNSLAAWGSVPMDIWAVVVGWCLFGEHKVTSGDDIGSTEVAGTPVERFGLLAMATRGGKRSLNRLTGDPATDFPLLDGLARVPSTLRALERSVQEDQQFCDLLRHRASDVPEVAAMLEGQLVYYDCFVRARRHMVTSFLAHPDSYLHPHAYLKAADDWSAPPVKVHCGSATSIRVPDDDFSGWYVHLKPEDRHLAPLVLSPPVEMRGIPHIPRESAFALYALFAAADQLIGPWAAGRSAGEEELASLLLGHPMRFLNVQGYAT